MLKIVVPFRSVRKNTNFRGIGHIYLKNGYIAKQEVFLTEATITPRNGQNPLAKGYQNFADLWPKRKEYLGDREFAPKGVKYNDEIALSRKDMNEIQEIINTKKTGTILSTLYGILCYVNVSGSDAEVTKSPLVIDGGKYDGYRFYNIFTNEFTRSSQIPVIQNNVKEITIEEWVDYDNANKMRFSLYNFDRETSFLKSKGFDVSNFKDPSYNFLLGKISNDIRRESVDHFISALRGKFKSNVMKESKYKYDFIYEDTLKINTEAAHIYEVNMIKKIEDTFEAVFDVNNCLLLTPSVHRAWDRGQIEIKPDGRIFNLNMEEKRFKRMFDTVGYKISYSLNSTQAKYLEKRNSLLNSTQ